jgi:hypothetical protein
MTPYEELRKAVDLYFYTHLHDDTLFLTHTVCGRYGTIGVTCFEGDGEAEAILNWARNEWKKT